MKTKLLFLSLFATVFAVQMNAQNRTTVNAMNYEISDNLDLRAVASIFGESRNLQDFERRLNDPEEQISNLDLNNDDEVDYLRVIETVENRTHVIIIQSVLDRDVYQDVATIDVEKDRYNKIQIQVVGNEFMYGQNYIYEPVYYTTPAIYASFWISNYRPYVSNWYWNNYPSYYYAWNPYPVFRYRNNIHLSVNINNNYNYVNYRRSSQAVVLYNSRRSNGYERQHPNYAFSRRNTNVVNRYELDRARSSRTVSSRGDGNYSRNRNTSSREIASRRTDANRDYSANRRSANEGSTARVNTQRDNSQGRTAPNSNREADRARSQRDYSQNKRASSYEKAPVRTQSERSNSNSEGRTSRNEAAPRVAPQRGNSENRNSSARQSAPERVQTQRTPSQNRSNSARQSAPQRTESARGNSSSRERAATNSRMEDRRS